MEKYITLEDGKEYEIAFICDNYIYLIDPSKTIFLVRKYESTEDGDIIEPLSDEAEFSSALELLYNDLLKLSQEA